MKTFRELREKKLTPAEKKKREEIAKAMEKDNPDMPMDKKMAIATATAKRVAEGYKSPAEAQAIADGKKAARKGKKYSDNPHKKGTPEFTAWSKGHNMARESVEVTEARKDAAADTYFNTYSAAVQKALADVKKKGFEVDEDDWHNSITTGSGKPGRGKTVRHTIGLTKGGKPQRKALHIQVYNRDTDKNPYELNYYVS